MTPEALILIVDDQPENLQMLSTTLREAAYQVAAANSGQTALRIFAKRLPDLVLCDVVMPDMDGYEVCLRLKALPQGQDIPLIFLTAKTDSQAILKGFESGAVDYVTKPFNTGELLARVRTQLELKQARQTILESASRLEELLRQKDSMLKLAAEELKSPLQNVFNQVSDLVRRSSSLSAEAMSSGLQAMQQQLGQILGRVDQLLGV